MNLFVSKKPRFAVPSCRPNAALLAAAFLMVVGVSSGVTWNRPAAASQNWNSNGNWSGGNSPNLSETADLRVDLTGNVNFTDGAAASLLYLGDTVGNNTYTFSGGLTIGGSSRQIIKTGQGVDVIQSTLSGNNGGISINVATGSRLDITGALNSDVQSLTKTGAGTLRLTGNYGINGALTVSGGTLVVDSTGSHGGSGTFIVQNGATVAGSGILRSQNSTITFQSGAIHTPGNSPTGAASGVGSQTSYGAQNNTSLKYEAGSIFSWDLNGNSNVNTGGAVFDTVINGAGSNAQMSATGAIFRVVLGSGVNFSDSFWSSNKTWSWNSIFTNFNSIAAFTQVQVVGSTPGTFSVNSSGLQWTAAVPEPSTALAGLLLGAGIFHRRRKTPEIVS